MKMSIATSNPTFVAARDLPSAFVIPTTYHHDIVLQSYRDGDEIIIRYPCMPDIRLALDARVLMLRSVHP